MQHTCSLLYNPRNGDAPPGAARGQANENFLNFLICVEMFVAAVAYRSIYRSDGLL